MGWLVDVEIRRSSVHGMGAFALEPIRKGKKVWVVDPTMKFFGPADLGRLPPDELRTVLYGGYPHLPSQTFVYFKDGMEYVNHADRHAANIGVHKWPPLMQDNCTALRDIEAGEELREDYTFWSILQLPREHWLPKIYRKHCPAAYDFLLEIEHQSVRQMA